MAGVPAFPVLVFDIPDDQARILEFAAARGPVDVLDADFQPVDREIRPFDGIRAVGCRVQGVERPVVLVINDVGGVFKPIAQRDLQAGYGLVFLVDDFSFDGPVGVGRAVHGGNLTG